MRKGRLKSFQTTFLILAVIVGYVDITGSYKDFPSSHFRWKGVWKFEIREIFEYF